MEDLVVLGLDEPEQSHRGHIYYLFGVKDGCDSYEDIGACNGCKCCKWNIDG